MQSRCLVVVAVLRTEKRGLLSWIQIEEQICDVYYCCLGRQQRRKKKGERGLEITGHNRRRLEMSVLGRRKTTTIIATGVGQP